MGKFRKLKGATYKGKSNAQQKGIRLNYQEIPKINESFEKYYKIQKICPEDEWDQMMASCRESLPAAFRVTGSRSESKAILHIIENRLIKDFMEVRESEEQKADITPFSLPWYPEKMAWQLNLTRKDIRSNEVYFRFHNFLMSETDSGYISRQEAVSMIPPLVLQVEPHHKVLDMCASPGSKTAQIIEMLHKEDPSAPKGYVVANDVDNKRCYMLVHQAKRLQSPAFVVTNEDGSKFPDLFLTGDDGRKVPLKFDRILCDVPCSGDGTIRKNIDVWKKWNAANSLYLSHLQYQILKRGIELLSEDGLLVYSTCSMSPIENEAVVHRLLKEALGAVELRDINLPNLKHMKGLSHWTVCDRDLKEYEKIEDVPEKWVTTIRPSAFPPTAEEAKFLNLNKCMRILPHQQNTGGFFIALLTKTKPLPWTASISNGATAAETSHAVPPPVKKPRRMRGYKEDPYIFMTDENEIWPKVKEFYALDESLQSTNFLKRTEEGKIKNLYFTTENVRNFVSNNDKIIKIINVGVKALARIENKWSDCNFRLSQEGLPALCRFIKERRVHVTKQDLILMLEQSEADKPPLLETFDPNTQVQINKISRGSLVIICDFKFDDTGPRCYLELVGWKGAASLRVYVQKTDRMHYLRLCGMNVSKYEVNKFKDKDGTQEVDAKVELPSPEVSGNTDRKSLDADN